MKMSFRIFLLLGFLLAIVLLSSTKVAASRKFAENNVDETKETDDVFEPKARERFDNERFSLPPAACKLEETKETDEVYDLKHAEEVGSGRFSPRLAIHKLEETKETDEVYDLKHAEEVGSGRFSPRLAFHKGMPHP